MKKIRSLTNILTPLRKEISRLELQRMEIGQKVRRSQWDPGSDNYRELKKIRQEILIKRLKVIKLEKDLSTARSLLYSVNKALNFANKALNFANTTHTITSENKGSSDKDKKKFGIEKEDYIEKMDLLPVIVEHFSSENKAIFLGTDLGTVITSITSPRSLETILANINRFNILVSYEDSSEDDENNPDLTLYNFNVELLPKPYKITADLINEVTFSKKHQKK